MPANGCSTNETSRFPFPRNRRNGKRPSISLSTFRKVRRHRQALARCSKSTSGSVPLDDFSTRTATTGRFRWGRPTPTRRCATCRQLSPSRPSKTAPSPSRHSRMRSKEPLARRLHPRWRSTLPSRHRNCDRNSRSSTPSPRRLRRRHTPSRSHTRASA